MLLSTPTASEINIMHRFGRSIRKCCYTLRLPQTCAGLLYPTVNAVHWHALISVMPVCLLASDSKWEMDRECCSAVDKFVLQFHYRRYHISHQLQSLLVH